MNRIIIVIAIMLFLTKLCTGSVYATERIFKVEAIDTMKYSRDSALSMDDSKISAAVGKIAQLHPSHIAIATPYDERFYPVLKTWVAEARKNNLHVWFRGNISAWEGWFDTPKLTNYDDHHALVSSFILNHPDLFADGDIFTPLPEAENGGPGDPRGSAEKTVEFNNFLIASYTNCVSTFLQLNKLVSCGYFSTNGDIAKQVLTKETVKKIGNKVVIDHYVKDPKKLISDIEFLHNKFDAPVILGEFGAPIPDIHGDMTDEEQSSYINQSLRLLAQKNDIVSGINYWTAFGGSTELFNANLSAKAVTEVISNYYNATAVNGKVLDEYNRPLIGVNVKSDIAHTTSDKTGQFTLIIPHEVQPITLSKKWYQNVSITADNSSDTSVAMDITMHRQKMHLIDYIRNILSSLFH